LWVPPQKIWLKHLNVLAAQLNSSLFGGRKGICPVLSLVSYKATQLAMA